MKFNTRDAVLFPIRLCFLPISVLMIGSTAVLEAMCANPDWDDWRAFNKGVFQVLPRWPLSSSPN